jgi:opacity protein-like surface antigen
MRSTRFAATLVVLCFAAVASASAQVQPVSATQTVTFAVNPINEIAFTGAPSLTIATAPTGGTPASVTDATSSWAVTTNQTGGKVSASLGSAMPANITLSVRLAAPAGATAPAGVTLLTTTPVDLVTGITQTSGTGLAVTYQLTATAAAAPTSGTRVVTYTLSGGT